MPRASADGVQYVLAGEALQLSLRLCFERELGRGGYELSEKRGDKHRPGFGRGRDSGGKAHMPTVEVVLLTHVLPGMESDSDPNGRISRLVAPGKRSLDGERTP